MKNKLHKVMLMSLIFYYSLSSIDYRLLYAEEKQWSGAGDGLSWEDSSNWFPAAVPTASDDVSIDSASANVTTSKTFFAKSLTVGGRQESAFTTDDFIYGTISPDKNTDNALYIKKDGAVTLKGPSDITLKGAFKNSEESLPAEPAFMFGAE